MLTSGTQPGNYKVAWSKDPALIVPEDDTERGNALRVARETSDWSSLIKAGQSPTWFVFRWLPVATYQRWWDARERGVIGRHEAHSMLLLLALVDVENFGGVKLEKEYDDRFRDQRVKESFLDKLRTAVQALGAYPDEIIIELATQVLAQEDSTRPF